MVESLLKNREVCTLVHIRYHSFFVDKKSFNDLLRSVDPAQSVDTMCKLGSVVGPVIQANERLTFEDDLRSGGLLCFTTQ